jgi:glycosyltransferase involved in cell wall biosynthesis
VNAAGSRPIVTSNGHKRSIPRIAFDTWSLGGHARNHGIHVYARQLLAHFRELGSHYGVEVMPYVSPSVDNEANTFVAASGFVPRRTSLLKFDRLWRFGGACALASLQNVDLVFSPHCTSFYIGNFAPAVVTIHDLTPLRMPWSSRRITATLRFCLWSAARFSRAIITDSLWSKQDLINTYGLAESKIAVVNLAYNKEKFNTLPPDAQSLAALKSRFGIYKPYILHHGVIKPSKNLARLIHACEHLSERNRNLDLQLVLAGPLGWDYDDVLAAANRSGRVVLTGALSDDDLATLVKGASLEVLPSLYEGFCIPLVEAMACGVPVIAANSSCLPEISGGLLRYFNPESVEEMSFCMEEALQNGDLRKELSEKGPSRAKDFDWRRCAEETLAVLARYATDGKK